jgi:hypothetical protein
MAEHLVPDCRKRQRHSLKVMRFSDYLLKGERETEKGGMREFFGRFEM